MAKGNSVSRTAVWILIGLLILGLGGFGAANLSGNIRSIGTVGDLPIPVDQYARSLQQEMRALNERTGEAMSFSDAQAIGLDRAVLQRLVNDRALDHEAANIGLSIGDETLRARILEISAFDGIDGSFDREAYRQSLYQVGMSEAEFETTLREETTRTLLQGAILSGVEMPATYAETLVAFITETRSFTWARLDAETLDPPLAAPTDAELATYFEENSAAYVLPQTKKITYALLSTDTVLDDVDLTQEQLRQEYDARADTYIQPERRLVERLVFADQETADQAAAALEVNGTTFELLVEERGLELTDVDMGDVSRASLGDAGPAVFDAEVGDVVGPLVTDLGPALFRVNAKLAGQNVSFAEAEPELRAALAADGAVRLVEARAEDLDDILAGGATLEQITDETEMVLGQIEWTQDSSEGLAAYGDFRQAAAALSATDFPRILTLDDGGVFAMRLDEELPERPAPFEAVAEQVAADWRAQQAVTRLTAQAEALLPDLQSSEAFAAAGLDATVEIDQTRTAFISETPDGFVGEAFEMTPGETRIVAGADDVFILRLDSISAGSDTQEAQQLVASLRNQQNEELARGLYDIYTNDTLRRAGQAIDPRALAAVHVNFQ